VSDDGVTTGGATVVVPVVFLSPLGFPASGIFDTRLSLAVLLATDAVESDLIEMALTSAVSWPGSLNE
jgi:hypothetical protein